MSDLAVRRIRAGRARLTYLNSTEVLQELIYLRRDGGGVILTITWTLLVILEFNIQLSRMKSMYFNSKIVLYALTIHEMSTK